MLLAIQLNVLETELILLLSVSICPQVIKMIGSITPHLMLTRYRVLIIIESKRRKQPVKLYIAKY